MFVQLYIVITKALVSVCQDIHVPLGCGDNSIALSSCCCLVTKLTLGRTEGKIEGRRRRGWKQRMRWLDGITNPMDMNLSKFQGTVKNREAWWATVHGIVRSQTLLSN